MRSIEKHGIIVGDIMKLDLITEVLSWRNCYKLVIFVCLLVFFFSCLIFFLILFHEFGEHFQSGGCCF